MSTLRKLTHWVCMLAWVSNGNFILWFLNYTKKFRIIRSVVIELYSGNENHILPGSATKCHWILVDFERNVSKVVPQSHTKFKINRSSCSRVIVRKPKSHFALIYGHRISANFERNLLDVTPNPHAERSNLSHLGLHEQNIRTPLSTLDVTDYDIMPPTAGLQEQLMEENFKCI